MNSEVIKKALKLNKKVLRRIGNCFGSVNGPIIAVLRTNGKTTTTVLTGEIFINAGIDTRSV